MSYYRFFSLGENYLIQFADAEASQYYHSFWSFDASVFNAMRIRMSETVVDLTECEATLSVRECPHRAVPLSFTSASFLPA